MKRSGFTMIELIFVIVILGILAAVALPKFIGVSEQAQVGKVKAFVGTLNRTVAPSVWSQSISLGDSGALDVAGHADDHNLSIAESLPPLQDITDSGGDFGTIDIQNCVSPVTISAPGRVGDADTNTTTAGGVVTSGIIGSTTYYIKCIDGNMSSAPQFWLTDGATVMVR